MKTTKIIYYAATGLITFAMLFSTFAYLTNPQLKWAFEHLGFPNYFRIELAIAKFLAAIAIWLPFPLAKDASYIGLAISFFSAVIAHVAVWDDVFHTIAPLVVLAVLIVSYWSHLKLFYIK